MKNITVPTREQVDSKSQQIFDSIEKNVGMLPNIYATIGYSSDALENFLGFSEKAGKSSFNAKEIEAIKLAVSEANGCEYCKAAHTAIAKMNGFSEEETLKLRAGVIEDERLRILSQLAREIALNRARVDEEYLDNFYAQGFDEKALIDLISAVIAITFTNYTHILTQVPVDFPAAKELSEELV